MSVTFSAEYKPEDLLGWRISCADDVVREERSWSPEEYDDEVSPAVALHGMTCPQEECKMYGGYSVGEYAIGAIEEINVNSANAAFLLGLLELPYLPEEGGECDPEEFLQRVLIAEGFGVADVGQRAVVMEGAGGQMIECGRPAGYGEQRLAELERLARECLLQRRKITWY